VRFSTVPPAFSRRPDTPRKLASRSLALIPAASLSERPAEGQPYQTYVATAPPARVAVIRLAARMSKVCGV